MKIKNNLNVSYNRILYWLIYEHTKKLIWKEITSSQLLYTIISWNNW